MKQNITFIFTLAICGSILAMQSMKSKMSSGFKSTIDKMLPDTDPSDRFTDILVTDSDPFLGHGELNMPTVLIFRKPLHKLRSYDELQLIIFPVAGFGNGYGLNRLRGDFKHDPEERIVVEDAEELFDNDAEPAGPHENVRQDVKGDLPKIDNEEKPVVVDVPKPNVISEDKEDKPEINDERNDKFKKLEINKITSTGDNDASDELNDEINNPDEAPKPVVIPEQEEEMPEIADEQHDTLKELSVNKIYTNGDKEGPGELKDEINDLADSQIRKRMKQRIFSSSRPSSPVSALNTIRSNFYLDSPKTTIQSNFNLHSPKTTIHTNLRTPRNGPLKKVQRVFLVEVLACSKCMADKHLWDIYFSR